VISSPYNDLARPPLGVRALQRALIVPGGFWRRLDVVGETGSTNADVAEAARGGVGEGLVVVAEQQVAGRGRRDRKWVSPARSGLTLSVLVRPGTPDPDRGWAGLPQSAWSWLPLLTGVALLEAVERITDLHAALKWPNDLLAAPSETAPENPAPGKTPLGNAALGETLPGNAASGKTPPENAEPGRTIDNGGGFAYGKTAGILAEVVGDAVVVGVGLNVSTRADELPETNGLPATSLHLAGADQADRDPLLRAFLRGFADWYAGWREAGGDAEMCGLLAAYRRGCATIGSQVRVLLPGGGEFRGVANDVDASGQLVVRLGDGAERRVSAGDVLHVR
jgi:BirA family transcriptional regulator, biotin operon repressor / biotin---[acetyl-CoA-carboxylase] ligase